MPDTFLTLGDHIFTGVEIPERIKVGGVQNLHIHKLVGGGKVVESLGSFDEPLSWSGMFLGEDALSKAKYIDYLRKLGEPVSLLWSQFNYTVVISSFAYDYEREYKIPYSITCEVVTNNVDAPVEPPTVDLYQALLNDLGAAEDIADLLSDGIEMLPTKDNMSKLSSALKSISDFTKATKQQIKDIKDNITEVQNGITTAIASVNNTLQYVTTLGGVLPNIPVSINAANMMRNVTAVNDSLQLHNLRYTVGNMDKVLE